MELEDYSYWFWNMIFISGCYEKVLWKKFRERLKMFPYEDRQTFWNVYHEFKDAEDKLDVMEDRRTYKKYLENEKKERFKY